MEQLIERLAAGDDDALAELYACYGRVAFGVARRILRDDALAEDAVQEAFLTLWRTADRYRPGCSGPKTWLLVLVHRRAVDLLRAEGRRRRPLPDDALFAPSGEEETVVREESRRARAALRQLSPSQRAVIGLAYFDGLTQSEIAARIGEPLGTVKSRTWSGLRRLRELLDEEEASVRENARPGAPDAAPTPTRIQGRGGPHDRRGAAGAGPRTR